MSITTSENPTYANPLSTAEACLQCGAPLEPLDRFCQACGATHETPVAAELADAAPAPPQRHLRCETCGAEISLDLSQRSYSCAFCDSNYVVEFSPEETGRQPPEFIIGFAVTPEEALAKFRDWLRVRQWNRPGNLHFAQIEDKLRGVYLPFWSFSMRAVSRWSASIGEHWHRTETYTTTENGKTVTKTRRVQETEWWDLDGGYHDYCSGHLVSASPGLKQGDAERIFPFQLPALRRYTPTYLAGWLSQEYRLDRDEALEQCRAHFAERQKAKIANFLPGDTHRQLLVETEFSDANSDLILLPIYLLSYRYQDKVYRFLVNGQTGAIAGDKPLSWPRIIATVTLGVALLSVLAIALFFAFAALTR